MLVNKRRTNTTDLLIYMQTSFWTST